MGAPHTIKFGWAVQKHHTHQAARDTVENPENAQDSLSEKHEAGSENCRKIPIRGVDNPSVQVERDMFRSSKCIPTVGK